MLGFAYKYGELVADLQTNLWPAHIGHKVVGRWQSGKLLCSCGAVLIVKDDQLSCVNATEFDSFVRELPLIGNPTSFREVTRSSPVEARAV